MNVQHHLSNHKPFPNQNNAQENNNIKNNITSVSNKILSKIKTDVFPSYSFKLSIFGIILLGGLIMLQRWIEKKNELKDCNIFNDKIVRYIKQSKHNMQLAEQDKDVYTSYHHIIIALNYLKEAKELADGKENLASITNIDYDLSLKHAEEIYQEILKKINNKKK